jgi:hypothetical protein
MALAFEEVGFIDFADEMWLNACVKGEKEGNVQELYSRRGYAWFLFRQQQVDDAREIIREALAKVTTETDRDRLVIAETLRVWINWEIGISGGVTPVVVELGRRIDELIAACVTARGRHLVSAWAWPSSPAVDGERGVSNLTAAVTATSAVNDVTPSNPRGSAVDARHDAQADSLS